MDWPAGKRLGAAKRPARERPAAKGQAGFSGNRYFEFAGSTSGKFWEVFQEGGQVITNSGRIGSEGRPKLKRYPTPVEAAEAVAKAVAEKVEGGYVEKTPAVPEAKRTAKR